MIPTLSLLASTDSGTAKALAVSVAPLPDKEALRTEQMAVDGQNLKISAERARTRSPERSACHAARLENMQKALTRLMAGHGRTRPGRGGRTNPVRVICGRHSRREVTEVSTGATDDAVAVQGAVVNVRTDDGADAETVEGAWVSVSTDDDAGNFGPTQYFNTADAVAISARHAVGIHTGGGDDAIAIVAGTFDQVRNDRIAVSVANTMGIYGGVGNDTIAAAGGTFTLHFAAGDGQDTVHLSAGAEAVVMLDASLTLRWGAGLSITFQRLDQAGAIGVSRLDS